MSGTLKAIFAALVAVTIVVAASFLVKLPLQQGQAESPVKNEYSHPVDKGPPQAALAEYMRGDESQ